MELEEVNLLVHSQLALYPECNVQDAVKALYQAELGCGHLVKATSEGLAYLKAEADNASDSGCVFEELGKYFVRVHLGRLNQTKLKCEDVYRLFIASAALRPGSLDTLKRDLEYLKQLIFSGVLPFNAEAASDFIDSYILSGCPPTHHSSEFRQKYKPAYRVVSKNALEAVLKGQ